MSFALEEYLPGHEPGKGINSKSLEPLGQGVQADGLIEPTGAQGATTYSVIDMIDSYEEFQSSIGVDASASFRYGFWHGSASASYDKQVSYNSHNIFMTVSMVMKNAFRQLKNPRLTRDAEELLILGNKDRFFQRFGDRWISGWEVGGQFVSTLVIEVAENENKEEISVDFEAGMTGVFTIGGSFNKKMKEMSRSYNMHVVSFQKGGEEHSPPTTVDAMLDKTQTFFNEVKRNPAPYRIALSPYTILRLPNDAVDPMTQEFNDYILRQHSEWINDLKKLGNDIEYVLKNPRKFVDFKDEDLRDAQTQINKDLNRIFDACKSCVRQPTQCKLLDPAPTLSIGDRMPKLKPKPKPKPTKLPLMVMRPYIHTRLNNDPMFKQFYLSHLHKLTGRWDPARANEEQTKEAAKVASRKLKK